MPGSKLLEGKIVYSSGCALKALAQREGAEVTELGIAGDTLEATTKPIRAAMEAGMDILATTGGASVGDHDVVQRALQAEGSRSRSGGSRCARATDRCTAAVVPSACSACPAIRMSSYVCATLFPWCR